MHSASRPNRGQIAKPTNDADSSIAGSVISASEPRFTPTWITVEQAARGWGVSVRQARRIILAEERRAGRTMRENGQIRTVDFLAVPRGDVSAAPMIPEVAILWARIEAIEELNERLMNTLAIVCKRLGIVPQRTFADTP